MLAEGVKVPVLDVIQVIEHGFQLLSVVVNGFGSDRSGADTSATTSFFFLFKFRLHVLHVQSPT